MINDTEASQIYIECVKKWGMPSQMLMVIEELNELAVVVAHGLRANKPFELEDFISEIADVQIMLEQLQIMLKIPSNILEDKRQKKLLRVKELLKV